MSSLSRDPEDDLFAKLVRGGREGPLPEDSLTMAEECMAMLRGETIGGSVRQRGLSADYPALAREPLDLPPEVLASIALHLCRQVFENPGHEAEVSWDQKREAHQGIVRVLEFAIEHFAPQNVVRNSIGLAILSTNPRTWLSWDELVKFLVEHQAEQVLFSRDELEGECKRYRGMPGWESTSGT